MCSETLSFLRFTMATAWVAYRPLYSLLLLVIPLVLVGLYHRILPKNQSL